MDQADAAKFLQVNQQTLRNWEAGRHEVPFAVLKLLRVLTHQELPGKSWQGWCFHSDRLWTPEGRSFQATDGSWWTLFARRAQMFDEICRENKRLKAQLAQHAAHGGAPANGDTVGVDAAPMEGVTVTVFDGFSAVEVVPLPPCTPPSNTGVNNQFWYQGVTYRYQGFQAARP